MPATTTSPAAVPSSTLRPNADSVAEQNWQRYVYGRDRGHTNYLLQAQRCEAFYLGGGRQWNEADKAKLRVAGRPYYEFNGIMPAVNAAIGYQIHNRMDIAFLPRGGMADSNLATIRSKVAKQITDHTHYHWKETQVFSDGLIEHRGYFDIRMNFDNNVFGDPDVNTLDPRDVIPDPDAKSYDPRSWFDVTVTRWYTLDEIENFYGLQARKQVQMYLDSDGDWGETEALDGERNKFGMEGPMSRLWDAFTDDPGARRYRIIDRQRWVYEMTPVAIYPTGDVKNVANATPEQLLEYQAQGAVLSKRMQRSIRWQVSTRWVTLHDELSPYDRFTVIPYFCYFRRGVTCGMIDNAIGPQEALNKAVSQFVHILNTTANSGWIVEENSLVNMSPEQLEDEGAKTGLLVIYKQGSKAPEKIKPNDVPQGIDRLIDRAYQALKDVTVPDVIRGAGTDGNDVSGVAIQSHQFAGQQQLAIPLDNLARTRHMVAEFFSYLMSNYMDNHRVFRITETDPTTGRPATNEYEVNRFDPAMRTWSNDLTEGDYDVVVSETPMQVTFEHSQFEQALELKKAGVNIPDNVLIKHSNLADKNEILDQLANASPKVTPVDQAKIGLLGAQQGLAAAKTDQTQADTASTRITSIFGATQAAQIIAQLPATAPLADVILGSAGFADQDAAPAVSGPAVPSLAAPPLAMAHNTHPQFPARIAGPTPPVALASPDAGAHAGIEGGRA
jgi:hypothetical protein